MKKYLRTLLYDCLLAIGMFFLSGHLHAQCDFEGQVVDGSYLSGCGFLILSSETSQSVLVPIGDNMGIQAGQIISFSYEPATGTGTCPAGVPVELTCVTVLNAPPVEDCVANFEYTVSPMAEPVVYFKPLVEDNSLSYLWNFGDGTTSTEISPEHTFDFEQYNVCLVVSGGSCNTKTFCKTIDLSGSGSCGFVVAYEYPDTGGLIATIFNTTGIGPNYPDAVEWHNPSTGEMLGVGPVISISSNNFSAVTSLCASFSVTLPGGDICAKVICQPLQPSPPGCVSWTAMNISLPCPAYYYPVCGCDGVTYNNECEASSYGGVSSWKAGPCPNEPNQCLATFFTVASGSDVTLYNTSLGNGYGGCQWDMGDGTVFTNQNTVNYTYQTEGIYTICLTVWDGAGCSSQFCDYFFNGAADELCNFTDCVYPGDTDKDGTANVYDLLPLGVGYATQGPPRDLLQTSITWAPQYSPDWGEETVTDVDYKHLDCNGDGVVNDFDLEAIQTNYAAPFDIVTVQSPGAPSFWLEFELDTIVVDDNSPPFIEIEADLMAGTPQTPVNDLRGFALQLDYPEDMVKEQGVEADYFDNSFFGGTNQILWLQKDRFQEEEGVLDLGFTKKSNHVNGYGKVAELKFIIIADVIYRSENSVPFTISVKDVVAVNEDGEMLTIGLPEDATVIILNKTTTGTNNTFLDKEVLVFPNPASDKIYVRLNQVKATSVETFDALGQKVSTFSMESSNLSIDVSQWNPGVYWLKIHTDKGIANRKMLVH